MRRSRVLELCGCAAEAKKETAKRKKKPGSTAIPSPYVGGGKGPVDFGKDLLANPTTERRAERKEVRQHRRPSQTKPTSPSEDPAMQPHVYVIHLKHRTDRRQQFLAAWTAAGLPTDRLHWFPAVLGAALPNAAFADFHTVARTRKARAGRLGAYLSHTGAIAAAIERNHFPLLILEDDAVPAEGPVDLGALFAAAPASANLLYFGALPVKDRKAVKRYCTRRRGFGRVAAGTQLYGGHAYGFRDAAAASHVLALLRERQMTFDSALVRYQKAHPGAVAVRCPFVFRQAEGYSDIEGTVRWRPS